MNIFVEGDAPVIKVDGVCYEIVGSADVPPDAVSEGEFSTCEDCLCDHPDTCGIPNGAPTLLATLTWADGDLTKEWLGCTWCNGQTKTVYATYYHAIYYSITSSYTYASGRQTWRNQYGSDRLAMMRGLSEGIERPDPRVSLRLNGLSDVHRKAITDNGEFTPSNVTISNLGLLNRGDMPPDYPLSINDVYLLSKQKNNTYTDANGITYTWEQGTGW